MAKKEKTEQSKEQGKDEQKEKQPKTIEEMHKKIEDLTDTLKRVQADFENYKKRAEAENKKCIEYASAGTIKKLLPILDSFDNALKHKEKHEEFIKGVELIHSQMCSVLAEEGLRAIDCVGKKFDPYKHEAMLQEEQGKEDNIVLEELQKGYMLKDAVLRHSKVKVSKAKKEEGQSQEKDEKEGEK